MRHSLARMRHLRLSGTVIENGIAMPAWLTGRKLCDSDSSSRIGEKFNGRATAEKWRPQIGWGKHPSIVDVARVFFFVSVREFAKRFSHVQKPGLVHRILYALGKANAFRGVSTVIDN